jgi:hypothetical protein
VVDNNQRLASRLKSATAHLGIRDVRVWEVPANKSLTKILG